MGKKARIKSQAQLRREHLWGQLQAVEQKQHQLLAELAQLEAAKDAELARMLQPRPDQKAFQLQDILTEEQITVCVEILNTTPDDIEQAKKLQAYLDPFQKQIEAKGFQVAYLAYVVVAIGHKAQAAPNPAHN